MTNTQTEQTCGCQTKGLAILPVRYTVVPTYIERPKPQWANLSSVTKVPLSEDYQYHVRRMREGYLYVYLPAELGDDQWQIYSIDNEGNLFKQPSNAAAKPACEIKESGESQCPELTKNSSHNCFITIANPQYQQKVYIAYSEFIWSDLTLKRHQQAPEKRMQLVDPAQWQNQSSSTNSATVATQSNLEQILDLDPQFNRSLLPYDEQHLVKADLSLNEEGTEVEKPKFNYTDQLSYNKNGQKDKQDGDKAQPYGFDDKVLKKNTTCHPWTKPQDIASSLSRAMDKHSQGYSPILLAIDDPLGIAHELNGYYSEIFAKNEQYRQEREFEFNAKESYEYAMEIFTQKELADDFKLPFTEHPYLKRVMKTQKIERSSELPIFSHYNQLSVLIQEQYYGKVNSLKYIEHMSISERFESHLDYNLRYKQYYDSERKKFCYEEDLKKYGYNRIKNYYRDTSLYATMINGIGKTKFQKSEIEHLEKKHVNNKLSYYNDNEINFIKAREEKLKDIREKYAKCLKTENFDQKYQSLLEQIAKIAEKRVKQLINWIKYSDFYLHLQDLKGNEWIELTSSDEQIIALLDNQSEIDQALADNEITEEEAEKLKKVDIYGIIYGAIIERSTSGLELTQAGKEQIEQWFMFDNLERDDHNAILWQALAYGSQDIVTDIQRILKSAVSIDASADVDEVYATTLLGKLASYYKKVQGFLNAVENYRESFDKAQAVIKASPSIVKVAESLGATMPKDSFLFKIFTSKSALWINNTVLRLSNFMFVIPNTLIQLANIPVAYLFHLSLCGIPKNRAKAYLDAQKNINRFIFNSPLQTKVTLPGGVVGELAGKERQKILARNAKFLHLQDMKHKTMADKLFNNYENKMPEALKHDMTTIKQMDAVKSGGTKDARLALLIGIFEAYNWYQLKQQQEELGLDEFWTKEMIKSSLALTAITAEIVAQYSKVVRGNNSVAFGRTKILSGFLGMAVSFWIAYERAGDVYHEGKKGNTTLALLNLLSGMGYFASGIFSFKASLTYYIPWLNRKIIKEGARKGISQAIINRVIAINTAKIMARRVLYLGRGFWVGLILIGFDVGISMVKDDDLEKWLKYSALGKESDDTDAHQDIGEQKEKFIKVLQSMFGITREALNNNLQDSADRVTNSDNDSLTTFNEYDALLLISQDLARQQANRESLLREAIHEQKRIDEYNEEAKYQNPRAGSIPDIFSGNLH